LNKISGTTYIALCGVCTAPMVLLRDDHRKFYYVCISEHCGTHTEKRRDADSAAEDVVWVLFREFVKRGRDG